MLEKIEIGNNFYFETRSSIVFSFIHLKTVLFSPALSGGLNRTALLLKNVCQYNYAVAR